MALAAVACSNGPGDAGKEGAGSMAGTATGGASTLGAGASTAGDSSGSGGTGATGGDQGQMVSPGGTVGASSAGNGGSDGSAGASSGSGGKAGSAGSGPGNEAGAPTNEGGDANAGAGGTSPSGSAGEGGATEVPECGTGEAHCDNGARVACDDGGRWSAPVACEFLCSGGECVGECPPGAERCEGGNLEDCSGQAQWQPIATCTEGCADETRCAFPDVCGHFLQGCCAAPGDRCQPDLVCDATTDSCEQIDCSKSPAVCPEDSACATDGTNSVCLTTCSDPGNGQVDCPEGNVCLEVGGDFGDDGACFPNCNLPGLECVDSVCDAQGYCVECVSGDARCVDDTLETCSADGAWEQTATCTEGCADETRCAFPDACGHNFQACCPPSGARCQPDLVCKTKCTIGTTCDAFGQCSCINNATSSACSPLDCGQDPALCPQGTVCANDGASTTCLSLCSAPGTGRSDCAEGNVCVAMGGDFGEQGACFPSCNLPGLACADSVCNANGYCVECIAGDVRCNGNDVETCGDDETWQTTEVCANVCDQGSCKTCVPGWSCDGTAMDWCSAEGEPTDSSIACTSSCDATLGRCNNALPGDCDRLYPCCSVLGAYAYICRNAANAGNDSVCYNWLQERWAQGECYGYATTGLTP